jgi:hypothetical protein
VDSGERQKRRNVRGVREDVQLGIVQSVVVTVGSGVKGHNRVWTRSVATEYHEVEMIRDDDTTMG